MATLNKADVPALGRAIYEERILPILGPEDKGRVVVIDVHTGDFEIAGNHLEAALRLKERRPNSFTWGERVGYPAVHRLGSLGYLEAALPSGHD